MSRSMQLAKERAKCPTCGQRPRLEPRTKRGLASAIRSENAALRALAGQLAEAVHHIADRLEKHRAMDSPVSWARDREAMAATVQDLRTALEAAKRAGLTR